MSRYHPRVLESLSVLLRCVERMPTKGELFTAQSPFFCIFIACLVAHRDEDRLVLRKWFDSIISGASGRSVSIVSMMATQLCLIFVAERTSDLGSYQTFLGLDRCGTSCHPIWWHRGSFTTERALALVGAYGRMVFEKLWSIEPCLTWTRGRQHQRWNTIFF